MRRSRTLRTSRTSRTSRGAAVALALSLAGTGAFLGLGPVPEAAAITPPVAFTADALPTWQPNGVVWALAEAGGTVFAGGTFSTVRPPAGSAGSERSAVNFAAFDAATGAPTSCTLSFTIGSGTATVRALTLSPDRKTLYAGGYFGAVNGTPVSSLAAVDVATCTVKTDFRPAFAATVRALAVTADTVYAGGDFLTVAGQPRQRFAAVARADGALRPFRADADEPGRAVEVTPDGSKVLLGGDFFTVNGTDTHALAVVDATSGALAKSYPGFIETHSVVKDIATDGTGFYTANEGTGGGVFDGRIALNLSDLGQRWRDTCLGATQAVLPYANVLYSASHAHDCSSVGEFPDGHRHHLLAQPTSGVGKLGWAPDTNDGIGEGIGPRVMTVGATAGTRYLWVGGEFTTVNGGAQQSLTRFSSTGDTGAPTVPVASAASFRPGEVQVRWRTSLDLDDSALTYRIHRNGAATPIGTVTADSLFFKRPQASWTDTTAQAGQSYTYRVTATDAAGNVSALSAPASVTVPAGAEAYPSQVRADGARLYWRYDESVLPYVADSSDGGDQAGVHLNAPALRQSPGAVSGASTAIGFNGTDAHVYADRRQTVGSTYSVETWFRTNTTRGGKLVGFGNQQVNSSGQYDKHVYMTNDGRLVFGVYTGATRTITTAGSYNDNAWHHVVATQGPGGMTLYVDGVQRGTLNVTTHENFAGYWRTGGDGLGGWPNRPLSEHWAGRLDETAVYPTVLSAAQVQNHYALATAPADSVVRVTASEDTYANAGAPGTNYGTSGSLAVRGTSLYSSYLRFALPAAPAGTVLKSATLSVKTSTMSGAGTTDTVSVVPVAGAWTEGGTTYANRPAVGAPALGAFPGVPDGSAVHTAGLTTATVAGALGATIDLALTSPGTDALWLWSSEAAANEGTPQLTLTFGKP
ncbi:LamG-like jellyroll fold domain-containing protein [Streptomyces sp. RerS4]|uniref:LamG-like jellyroll fold domain-containing protein n=1 Tax=Streptomyces sp. RerS4 TaxID=2942449 RepID=UPI00201C0920|nr:LamG-like jellyroll fold domain-containing protein [Streptomyces sp. RerS4]UQW99774.1 DNRLRE domain-containing protein [Streptomyces sp. RerS4]